MGIATPHDVALLRCNRNQNFGYYTNLYNALRTGRMHFGLFSEEHDLRYWVWRNQDQLDGVIVVGDNNPTTIAFVGINGAILATVAVHPTTITVLERFEAQHGEVDHINNNNGNIVKDREAIACHLAASTIERVSRFIPGFRLLHTSGTLSIVIFK